MLADAAQTDHPHRLAGQLVKGGLRQREVRLIGPLKGAHGLVVGADVMADLQEQRKDELGDGPGAVDRDVGNGNTAAAGSRDIDAIKSRCNDCDELQCGQAVDQLGSERRFIGDQDSGPGRALSNFLGRGIRVDLDLAESIERRPGIASHPHRPGIQYDNLHG